MILKMWVRGKFVLCQRRFYNLLTKDKYHVFEVLIFFEGTATVSLKKFSSSTIFRWNFFEKFYIIYSNSIILVGDLIRWNKDYEIFLIDHYVSDIGNKNIAGKY